MHSTNSFHVCASLRVHYLGARIRINRCRLVLVQGRDQKCVDVARGEGKQLGLSVHQQSSKHETSVESGYPKSHSVSR